MKTKSYDIDPVLEEVGGRCGFMVFLFEDDDCVWEQLMPTKDDAVELGENYLSGRFQP